MSKISVGAQPTLTQIASSSIPNRDRPTFWVGAIVVSVTIHLLAFWIVHLLMLRQQTVKSSTEPIPIELIGESSQASSVTSTPESQESSSSTQKTANLDISRQTSSVNQASTQSQTTSAEPVTHSHHHRVENSQATNNSEQESATSKPAIDSAKDPPRSNSTSQTEDPVAPEKPAPTPAGDITKNLPSKDSVAPASTSSASNQTQAQHSQSEGKGIVAVLSDFRAVNSGKDIPDKLAQPQHNQKEFASIAYPSKVQLKVVLLIDNAGTVQQVFPKNGNIDSEQLALASKIFQQWKFDPAYQAGSPVYSNLEVVLTVAPAVG